ncbi:Cytochrome P450 71A9 [Morella rubra]|uniref:Cytochrome P450 71A9 n=1 Tax=Morella rubra TaxID=262757 RepID=A0A6A1UQ14_9ROSI|nr:Cytochrome P450 71A9 [Morella rubra]KAB1201183.1 Cytochrome P450 71A9 [Morella rubra]
MESFYLPVLLFATFFFLILSLQKWQSRPQSPRPPSPPGLPIIGHLHLLTDMPHHSLAQLANKLGPIVHLRLGQVPTVVVSSAHLAKLVLKTHDHIFASRPQLLSAQYLSFGCSDVTFSPYGPYWRQARKICVTELLSSKRVSSFQLIRDEEVNRLLGSVSAQSGSEIDLGKLFFTLANDILCRVAFGKRFKEESGEGQKRRLVEVLTETQALFAGFCLGDFFPDWEWVNSLSGYKRRLTSNLDDLRAVCDEIIREHVEEQSSRAGVREKEDFVDVLLRVQQRADLEVPITDDNLKALVLDMFVAGTDTSSATLEWTMTELARNPMVMKKAQEEVRNIASSTGKVEESHLQHLHYLKAVIKETMRLHPPVPLLVPRESMEKCNLDGYEIPAKSRILINAYAIGRDPQSWENPLEYNPERFMGNDIDIKDQDFRFLPFGGGRRGCPGYSFGLATVEIALARLLYHFDWALPKGVGAEEMDLSEIFGLATRKRTPIVLVPTAIEFYEFKG